VRRVLRFLEVDDTRPIEPIDANPSVGVRSLRVDKAISGLYGEGGPVFAAAKRAVRAVTSQRMRTRAISTVRRRVARRAPQPADEAVMADLRRRYSPEVAALSEYLGRDLVALWGYDRAG
jgi:hypothetical protein